ncbi:MAG: PIN domain-containing protein [Treponemataceae bacterium]|nr:MAG: PIN domain-containing protein [Treponemataceae bacterium]
MKIIVDTNVVLDAIASRSPFDKAAQEIIRLAAAKEIDAAITASTASDIFYIARKYLQSAEETIKQMRKLFTILDIISVEKSDCLAAFETGMSDYEDSLLAVCALRWNADCIITRHAPDFAASSVPAIAPTAFLEKIRR